jgi:uncharacterized protein with NAD-binding domain and iron-sulfur cluster
MPFYTGEELSHLTAETRRVSVNHCFAGTNFLTTAIVLQQPSEHSTVKRGGYRAMSECRKYQLLLQIDYVRLREKYDYLYIYSHNTILHCP